MTLLAKSFAAVFSFLFLISCSTQKDVNSGSGHYLILEYSISVSGNESINLVETNPVNTVIFEIDQNENSVYEVHDGMAPLKHVIEKSSPDLYEILNSGETVPTIYELNSTYDIIQSADTVVKGENALRFEITLKEDPQFIQEVIIKPLENARIAFPLKDYSIAIESGKNNKASYIPFVPELFEKGIPIRVKMPMPLDGLIPMIVEELSDQLPDLAEGAKVSIPTGSLGTTYLEMKLVDMHFADKRTVQDIKVNRKLK